MTIRLACYISAGGGFDWGCYAAVALDQASAQELLAMRAALTAAARAFPRVQHVDIWDARVYYYDGPPSETDDDLEAEWVELSAEQSYEGTQDLRTDIDMVVITPDGLWWNCLVGDITVETPEITWPQLEEIARGGDPFAEPAEARSLSQGR